MEITVLPIKAPSIRRAKSIPPEPISLFLANKSNLCGQTHLLLPLLHPIPASVLRVLSFVAVVLAVCSFSSPTVPFPPLAPRFRHPFLSTYTRLPANVVLFFFFLFFFSSSPRSSPRFFFHQSLFKQPFKLTFVDHHILSSLNRAAE